MKTISAIVCLVLLGLAASAAPSEARPKRSVIYTAPVVAAVGTVPVVHTQQVVHSHPTTVVKTQQVSSGDQSSYSYSTETRSHPVVHTHAAVAAAPVASVATVPVASAVPAYHYAYPAYHYPSVYTHYSPYSYVVGK